MALLDTYETEQRPSGALTVDQAYTGRVRRVDPKLGVEADPPMVEELTIEIGYRYGSPAIHPDPAATGFP